MNKKNQESKLPLNRIKKIMQTNKEIGKIQNNTPLFIAKALELFIEEITKSSVEQMRNNNDLKVTPSHVKEVIEGNEKFKILAECVAKVPKLEKNKTAMLNKRKLKEKDKGKNQVEHLEFEEKRIEKKMRKAKNGKSYNQYFESDHEEDKEDQ